MEVGTIDMTIERAFERIDSLEIIVTEQQQTIDDLNEMITKQWDALDLLRFQLSKMTDQIQELEETQPAPAVQKAPPLLIARIWLDRFMFLV